MMAALTNRGRQVEILQKMYDALKNTDFNVDRISTLIRDPLKSNFKEY